MVKIFELNPKAPSVEAIAEAAAAIRTGGLVIYPTETVYGLGADARSDEAVVKVFAAKARPLESPISIAVNSIEMAREVAELTRIAETIFEKFTPGPLTVVLKARPTISKLLTAGTEKVGIRIPDHLAALKLIDFVGGPITTTSANITGSPPPTTARGALEQLGGEVDIALDAGECELRKPSTVVDASSERVKILREGPIPASEIESYKRVPVFPRQRD